MLSLVSTTSASAHTTFVRTHFIRTNFKASCMPKSASYVPWKCSKSLSGGGWVAGDLHQLLRLLSPALLGLVLI